MKTFLEDIGKKYQIFHLKIVIFSFENCSLLHSRANVMFNYLLLNLTSQRVVAINYESICTNLSKAVQTVHYLLYNRMVNGRLGS